MPFDDSLANGQTHAGAGILCTGVQTLENHEYSVELRRIYPDTIIAHLKQPFAPALLRRDFYPRWVPSSEFNRIADQVLKHLRQLDRIGAHRG